MHTETHTPATTFTFAAARPALAFLAALIFAPFAAAQALPDDDNDNGDDRDLPPIFGDAAPDPAPVRPGPAPAQRQVQRIQAQTRQTEEEPPDSTLVDNDDPRMRESVGLIRIPGMGTNEVLEMLENFTRKPILRQQNLPAVNITFFSQQAMTRGEAILAIESLLALNGIAITEVGERFLKAVPVGVINTQVAPRWEGSTLDATPSQKLYERLYRLEFLNAPEAAQLIQPLMSQGAPIAFDKSNFLLITDALINHQRLERLLKVIDAPAALNTEILFYQLTNIPAQEALRRLQQVQSGPLRRQLENNTTFDADDRTNQLIVFTHPENAKLIDNLIERLDIDVAPLTSTRVINIRHAQAEEVVRLIEQVVSGQKQARDAAQGTRSTPTRSSTRQPGQQQQQPTPAQAAAAAIRGEGASLQFSDLMTLVADERANTIVVSGTQSDLRFLESLIEEIDIVLAQVRIEVIITEVTLSHDYVRGLDAFGITHNVTAGYQLQEGEVRSDITGIGGPNTILRPRFSGIDDPALSVSPIILGPGEFSMDLILRQGRTSGNVQVLSAPTIVTTHNREANISIVRNVPIITQAFTSEQDQVVGGIRQNIQYRDVGIELNVTPLIGSNGVVQLEVEQSVSDQIPGTGVGGNPVFSNRQARSYVSVSNGEIVVLGGLQQLNTSDSERRIFLLGDIPVLGNLFRRKEDREERTELLIFIRPFIVANTAEANADARSRLEIIESREDAERYLDTGTFRRDVNGDDDDDDEDKADSRPTRRRFS
ncbi:MAG: hypothetical protein JJU00_15265 [Opitutales bacterium]|nr:hypothetical protein [Opitutales bacterium]